MQTRANNQSLMKKIIVTGILAGLFSLSGYSQKQKVSKEDQATLDSMMKKDELLNGSKKDKESALDVSVGVGNGAFSSHNRATNSLGQTNLLIFTPSVYYHHKSGFGIGVKPYISNDSANSGLYQTGIIGSYDYDGDDVKAGVNYTHYISDQKKYNSLSIFQHDFYGYLKSAKGAVRPLFSVGYSSGKYREIATVPFQVFPGGPIRLVRDSTDNTNSSFTLTGGIEHDFNISKVFDKEDELEIVPSIVINAGQSKLASTHTNASYARFPRFSKRYKNTTQNEKFQFESVAAALDISYSIGKFFFQPSVYVDYYLPSTTSNRLNAIYSIVVGFSF